jgi:hypothetical protein
MRRSSLALAAGLFVSLSTSLAGATITEPNGQILPVDSMNGEVQLYTFFSNQGEAIDYKVDGFDTPDVFEPKCQFTAKFLLNEAGSHFGLAWYNATGAMPTGADLHVIVPPNSPVGTTVTSMNIKTDPAYMGGAIGFALVGGQTHYTESKWNPNCSGCSMPGPWIMAIKYKSKNVGNAYYIAFEDGDVTSNSFNNDGDYNDDVYLVTGVTCQGGGTPCTTGKPGVCAVGINQCTQNGVTCQQVVQPKTEVCDGVDNDCNGSVDDGNLCQAGFICQNGSCIPGCGKDACPAGTVCDVASDHCVDTKCLGKTCSGGTKCVAGNCVAPCDGVTCPYGQVCYVGVCADPCGGIKCDAGYVCKAGACVDTCQCAGCPAGNTCNADGSCTVTACDGKTCPAGQYCDATGACKDACAGAVCPSGSMCSMGACVPIPSGMGGMGGAGGASGGAGAAGTAGAAGGAGKGGGAGAAGAAGGAGASGKGGASAGAGGASAGSGGASAGAGGAKAGAGGATGGAAGKSGGAGATGGTTAGKGGAAGASAGGAGKGGATGGKGGAAGSAASATPGEATDSGSSGGCGCRTAGSSLDGGAASLAALGLLGLVARRRRRVS